MMTSSASDFDQAFTRFWRWASPFIGIAWASMVSFCFFFLHWYQGSDMVPVYPLMWFLLSSAFLALLLVGVVYRVLLRPVFEC